MFPKLLLPLITVLVFLASLAHAQIDPAEQERALRSLEQTQQKQQNFLKNLENEQKRQMREKKPSVVAPKLDEKEAAPDVKGPCFTIKAIELKGTTILKGKELTHITKPYIGTCMGMSDINNLMRQTTNYYVDGGYVTTRVTVPQQDLTSGHLELMVMEGNVEEITLNNNTKRDKMQVAMAFPSIKDKVLNLRDVEQGLDQLNRLASSTATMQLIPGDKQGGTKIMITNTVNKLTRASIGYDNSGQPATVKNKGFLSLERDNLLGLGESWSFLYNQDTDTHNAIKNSNVYSANFSLPFGYWTFSQSLSRAEYLQTIQQVNETFLSSGQTNNSTTRLERVIFRNQHSKLSLNTALKLKDTKSFIRDDPTAPGTYQLTILNAGVDYTLRALDAIWGFSGGYERGIDALGAKRDADSILANEPHAQFDKYTADISIYKPFTIKSAHLGWRSTVSGQYTNDTLYSSESLSVGDRYTVRGFHENSLIGDSGVYNRNELLWDLPQFTENKHINSFAGTLQPYIGLDMGMTRASVGQDAAGGTGAGYVSGWVTGIRNNSEYLSFDLAYAQKIKSPAFLSTEDHEIYFMVSTKIGF